MKDKVLIAITGVLAGAGGVIVGVLIRQPEINKLQKQVELLQADISERENVVADQNNELAQMLLNYRALKVYQFSKRKKMKESIQDQLICQYAAADYLSLLVDCVSCGKQMSTGEIQFYKAYGKMIEDDHIDDREMETLRPLIYATHGDEINRLKEPDLNAALERIKNFSSEGEKSKFKGLFRG